MTGSPRIRIGTQGWAYDHWAGDFYPPGLPPADRLAWYARAFDVIEVDSTFYGPPPPERYRSWAGRTPDGFMFTLKMPGEVTHQGRLRDARPALRFCDDASALGPRLGPILVQLPPDFGPDQHVAVATFLRQLPSDLRFAIEFRDRGWFDDRTFDLLREVGAALAVSVGPWLPEAEARAVAAAAPGRLLYLRWLGTPRHSPDLPRLAAGRDTEIEAWGRLIRAQDRDDVYAFFNNDYQGHSPASARRLQAAVGQRPVAPGDLSPQTELFG
jgi:uncharacterized protein YecE (DUF72 family)